MLQYVFQHLWLEAQRRSQFAAWLDRLVTFNMLIKMFFTKVHSWSQFTSQPLQSWKIFSKQKMRKWYGWCIFLQLVDCISHLLKIKGTKLLPCKVNKMNLRSADCCRASDSRRYMNCENAVRPCRCLVHWRLLTNWNHPYYSINRTIRMKYWPRC